MAGFFFRPILPKISTTPNGGEKLFPAPEQNNLFRNASLPPKDATPVPNRCLPVCTTCTDGTRTLAKTRGWRAQGKALASSGLPESIAQDILEEHIERKHAAEKPPLVGFFGLLSPLPAEKIRTHNRPARTRTHRKRR